ncbi:MAG TPA: hypothetical protein VM532_08980, partial [Burkholderiales bacterium]|nr:hypothetical protein [Burkholderiales bacterium]
MKQFQTSISQVNFAIKLESVLTNGDRSHGTGFRVFYGGRHWLFTCRHLIESQELNFSGCNEAVSLQSLNPLGSPV